MDIKIRVNVEILAGVDKDFMHGTELTSTTKEGIMLFFANYINSLDLDKAWEEMQLEKTGEWN